MAAFDNAVLDRMDALLERNPHTRWTLRNLHDTAFLDNEVAWGPGERDALLAPLRAGARLAAVEPDPLRAGKLLRAGYASVRHILRDGADPFIASVAGDLGAVRAAAIYRRAQGVRSRSLQRFMRLREAASPYASALAGPGQSRQLRLGDPVPTAPGLAVNYQRMFGESLLADVPHDASILGPGAYFADLFRTIEDTIESVYPGRGALALAARRPDLRNLLLTPENATSLVSNADLVLEILESLLAGATGIPSLQPTPVSGAPAGVAVLAAWPAAFQQGTTYVFNGAAAVAPTATGIAVSATLRSGTGRQAITVNTSPVVCGAAAAQPAVLIEGFDFSFDPAATAPALLQFTGGLLTLRNCLFQSAAGATAPAGWAIACAAGAQGTVVIDHCTFVDAGAAPANPAIVTAAAGALTVLLGDSIVWPANPPAAGYAVIANDPAHAIDVDFCDILGGKEAIALAPAGVQYGASNFDAPPFGNATSPLALPASSPCIGRASDGTNVGAMFAIHAALAWAIYPSQLPLDLSLQSARFALTALGADLDAIDRVGQSLVDVTVNPQNQFFPLSQLNLSLADYLILTTSLSSGLEPYFGRTSFDQDAVVVAPPAPDGGTGPWQFVAGAFAAWLDLGLDELRDLVYQDLSAAEIAYGIQGGAAPQGLPGWRGFFVNGCGAADCNILELRTQNVPPARFALGFGGSFGGSLVQTTLGTVGPSFTCAFWMHPTWPEAGATVYLLAIGTQASWQLLGTGLVVTLGAATTTIALAAYADAQQWLHVATVYDSNVGTLVTYVDGQLVASVQAAPANLSGLQLFVGSSPDVDHCYTGLLGELSLWSLAQTAGEIAGGYQRPPMAQPGNAAPVPAALLAYWPFDDRTAVLRNWAAADYPNSALNCASQTVSWSAIGLPGQAPTPGARLLQDGLSFVQVELLTGRPTGNGAAGVTAANLDRINRFVRLARRLGWSCADLEWALFTLSQAGGENPPGFATLPTFAALAQLQRLGARLELSMPYLSCLFGVLKPFGLGRDGTGRSAFDQAFNPLPVTGITFAPGMALALSVKDEVEAAGPVARRLASVLALSPEQVSRLVQRFAAGNTSWTVTAATLAILYRHRVLIDWMQADLDGFLDLLDFASFELTSCTPASLDGFLRTVDWTRNAGLRPADLQVLVTSPSAAPADRYQRAMRTELEDALPALVDRLQRDLAALRITPASFITPNVDTAASAALFDAAVAAGYVDATSGTITSTLCADLPVAPYRVPSAQYAAIGDGVAAAVAALAHGLPDATVLIGAGAHELPGDAGISVVLAGGHLRIVSEAGAAATIVDCNGKQGFLMLRGRGSVAIEGLTIRNGKGAAGGAIDTQCDLKLTDCIVQDCSGANGGGVQAAGSALALVIDNCVFYNNAASGNGGALSLVGANATVIRSTLYANRASGAAGVFADTGSSVALINSIAWDTIAGGAEWNEGAKVKADHCDLQGKLPVNANACITDDPKLVDPSHGLFLPASDSKCIGAGTDDTDIGYGGDAGGLSLDTRLFPFAYGQLAALQGALADAMDADDLPLDTVLAALGAVRNGLAILVPSVAPEAGVAYLRQVYQLLLLAYLFDLDGRLLGLLLTNPSLLGLTPPVTGEVYLSTAADVRTLAQFAALRKSFPDVTEELVALLDAPPRDGVTPAQALAGLFDWDTDDVATLLAAAGAVSGSVPLPTILGVAAAIAYAERTGLDADLLLALYTDGTLLGDARAAALLEAVDAANSEAAASVRAALADLKRRTLLPLARTWVDGRTRACGFPIANDDDLSDYLLVDVRMGVQTSTSRVVQGTLALQQYVQRCQLGLEPGVGATGLTEKEWAWRSTYRGWEENRKVFLYPETYLRPELRKNKTPLFVELERELANAEPTRDGLEMLYRRYLDRFAAVASLATVGAYYEPGNRIDSSLVCRSTEAAGAGLSAYPAFPGNWALPAFTVEAWLQVRSALPVAADNYIFLQTEFVHGSGWSFALLVLAGQTAPTLRATDSAGNSHDLTTAGLVLQSGTWSHVCGVLDSGTLSLYIDGQLQSSCAFDVISLDRTTPVVIGEGWTQPMVACNELAELRLWMTARTQQQILAGMHRRIAPADPDFQLLVGYWPFDNADWNDRTGLWNASTASGDVGFGMPSPPLVAQGSGTVDTYHFIGRTATQPYAYYHRTHRVPAITGTVADADAGSWSPWQPIDLAIDAANATPVVVAGRLYLFWAEVGSMPVGQAMTTCATLKYSLRNADGSWLGPQSPFAVLEDLGSIPPVAPPYAVPILYHGATAVCVLFGRLGSTLTDAYILGQDQGIVPITPDAASYTAPSQVNYEAATTDSANHLVIYEMQPILVANYESRIAALSGDARHGVLLTADGLSVRPVGNQLGAFWFQAGEPAFLMRTADCPPGCDPAAPVFVGGQVIAWPGAEQAPFTVTFTGTAQANYTRPVFFAERMTSTAAHRLTKVLAEGGIAALLAPTVQRSPEFPFETLSPTAYCLPPADDGRISFAAASAFGLYYREIFFFIPWLMAQQLRKNRRFKEAGQFLDFIFSPIAGATTDGCWRCAWLQETMAQGTLAAIEQLDPAALAAYHQDPFDASAIADLRPAAYQRAIVTAYVGNLIAWGDDLFQANTRETLHEAEQLYRFASDLLGARPQRVDYVAPPPATWAQLDAAGGNEFLLQLDDLDATGASMPLPLPQGSDPGAGIADLAFYFGLPDNPEFLANWDVVADRLYKIRNGLTITGELDDLPLFAPEGSGSGGSLAAGGGAAAAAGDTTAAQRQDAQARFSNFLFSARMLANSVIEFGGSLLRALELRDAEGLAAMQAGQQAAVAERLRLIRVEEVNAATAMAGSLVAAKKGAEFRRDYFAGLLQKGWSAGEIAGVALAASTVMPRGQSLVSNLIAAPLWGLPNIVGVAVGGGNPGGGMQAIAAAAGDTAAMLSEAAGLANTIASYERRAEDWKFQRQLADLDLAQLDAQIRGTERQLQSQRMQYALEQFSAQQTGEIERYLRGKFTNAELYAWMADTLSTHYHALYQVALGAARMTQACFGTLSGLDANFVSPGGWDTARKGLLAGESLLLDLARLEQAYWQWDHATPTETVTKTVTLKRHDPLAWLQLVATGACVLRLPESLYDRDHPGHYLRLLKSVAVQLPDVRDERRDVCASLARLSHDVVRQPDIQAVRFLQGTAAAPGPALRRRLHGRRSALSHADVVQGRDQPAFHSGDLDLFEGTGAVSNWRLELPPGRNRLDYRSLGDVVFTMRYTARHGGEAFERQVAAALHPRRGVVLVEIARDHPTQWQAFADALARGEQQPALQLPLAAALLPHTAPGQSLVVTAVHLGDFARAAGAPPGQAALQSLSGGRTVPLVARADALLGQVLSAEVARTADASVVVPWQLAATPAPGGNDPWLLIEYEEA